MKPMETTHPERVIEKTSNNVVVTFSDDFCAGVHRRSVEFNARRAAQEQNQTHVVGYHRTDVSRCPK